MIFHQFSRGKREGVDGAHDGGDLCEAREGTGFCLEEEKDKKKKVSFSAFRRKKNKKNKKKQKTHSVFRQACSARARRLPRIALSRFDSVGGGGPPASRLRAGLIIAIRSPKGPAFFCCFLDFLSSSTTLSGLLEEEEEEEVEGASSSPCSPPSPPSAVALAGLL